MQLNFKLKDTLVCDIDGTIANCEHRKHYVTSKPKNHDAFYAGVGKDTAILPVMSLVHRLIDNPVRMVKLLFVTGRPERCRNDTVLWLQDHGFHPRDYMLHMRKDGDYRQDYIIKQEILDKYIDKERVWLVLDDRKQVVDMWRRNGLTCLQVAEGDF
jgi:hypothetical protein